MARTFYDNLPLNQDIVLDWPFLEGTGTLIHDQSKSGSIGTREGAGGTIWPAETGQPYYGLYLFQVWTQYINCPAADCPNLNFTSGDYSLACWFNWSVGTDTSQILMGKYILSDSGWEVYLTESGGIYYLTVRHHHSLGASLRTASYSIGWLPSTLHCWSYSRTGTTAQHYMNGLPIATVSGTLIDPESSAALDLRCGCRFTEDSNWLNAYLGRPRAWSRALTAAEHRQIFAQGNAQ